MKPRHKSWVMRLPRGIREQTGWLFIGAMTAISGLTYLLDFSTSIIAQFVDKIWLQAWGGFLFVTGILLVIATSMANRPLEKLALRFLSLGILIYMGWVVAVAPIDRAAITMFLCVAFMIVAEVRVAVIRILLKPLPDSVATMEVP